MAQTNQQGSRPGQMTAVMRAVAASGPKVLRIGVVQGGHVIEERIIQDRIDVIVGPSEKSLFVLSSDDIKSTHKLFETSGEDYVLNFLDSMGGRVALPTGVSDLEQLKGQARRSSRGVYQIRLSQDSRGKIIVGETTFLFQFVAPPPVQPRPQLPAAVIRGAGGIDWTTTIIAAFVFFAHFMFIGSMYSTWLDPVVDEQVSLEGLVDTLDQIPLPPPEEQEAEDQEEQEPTEDAEPDPEPQKAAPASANIPTDAGPKLSNAQKVAISNELDQLSMMTLGALAGAGPATAGVLRAGDVPTGSLDSAAASGAGVSDGGSLKLGGGGGAVQTGGGKGLASLGSTSTTSQSAGKAKVVQGPKGKASVSSSVAAGSVSNAASVVARMRAGFNRCYNRGLAQNPDIAGKIRLTLKIGPGGEVAGVKGSSSGNIPGSVLGCVKARARSGRFSPPQGGSAVIVVPVSFVKQ
ncbi:MAG: AgmX/PglI C-terminal domain-containing protein [Polyangiaceae bacterium]|nr:AgmX/PglI C-terminal domain-containing protein [Polyangiaceae bacterium]